MYFITHLEQGVVFFLSFSRNLSPIFQGIIESTHDYNTACYFYIVSQLSSNPIV